MNELAQHPPARPGPQTGWRVEPWPGPGPIPAVPGSSTDPPPGGPPREAQGPHPSDPGINRGTLGGDGGRRITRGGLQGRATGDRSPGDGADPLPSGDLYSDGEDFLPPLSDVPDFFVPFPGRGGPPAPPCPGRGAGGQLEPD